MRIHPIDINKSKQVDRLIYSNKWDKFFDYMLPIIFTVAILFVGGINFFFNLKNNNSVLTSLFFLICCITIACLLMYWTIKNHSLIRIQGTSRGKNSKIIKDIAKENDWNIRYSNQEITVITFPYKLSSTDWGKEMTILYDKNDILVNCISYGLHSSPSPFHWAANTKKVNKLKSEFKKWV